MYRKLIYSNNTQYISLSKKLKKEMLSFFIQEYELRIYVSASYKENDKKFNFHIHFKIGYLKIVT